MLRHNRQAWDAQVGAQNRWTVPVDQDTIQLARNGNWSVLLTPLKPVPENWFPSIGNLDILCLASAGGQQAPVFAAAGANVTVIDNSPAQLQQDRYVAERENLEIKTVCGDMADLSIFGDASFDLVFHPVSNVFVPDVNPVWKEAFRVLRPGGILLAGFNNPVVYIFDIDQYESGTLVAKYALPYADDTSLTSEEKLRYLSEQVPLEFGHLLEDQIGGQLIAGFHLTGFYEDYDHKEPLSQFMPGFIATRAVKPG
ncbi:MAG: class I SAM-dependent methyltransferase [Chloroflexota bacterium]